MVWRTQGNSVELEEFIARRAAQGDAAAFEQIFHLFRDRIYATAYRITGRAEDAEDVLQETFLSAYHALADLRPDTPLGPWLYRIAVHAALNLNRSRGRRGRREASAASGPEQPATAFEDPARRAERQELRAWIEEAARRLPEKQRVTFILRHFDGLSLEEIAQVLDCAVGTVKANLSFAVRKMRESLGHLR